MKYLIRPLGKYGWYGFWWLIIKLGLLIWNFKWEKEPRFEEWYQEQIDGTNYDY